MGKPYKFPIEMKRSETAKRIKGFRAKAEWGSRARRSRKKNKGRRQ